MNVKKLAPALILLVCTGVIGLFFFRGFLTDRPGAGQQDLTRLENAGQADDQISQALKRLKNSRQKATVITHTNPESRQLALTFDGLAEERVVRQILVLLQQHKAKATFFVDGLQTAEEPQSVINIQEAGHRIENYTFLGLTSLENLSVERLVAEFCRAQKIISDTTGRQPSLLKCNDTEYTDQVLAAAKASGLNSVVQSDAFLEVREINSLADANAFVSNLRPGSIVSVKLKKQSEPAAGQSAATAAGPAADKQPGLKALPEQAATDENDLVQAVERLLVALDRANYTTVYVEDFSTSNGLFKPGRSTSLLQSGFNDGFAYFAADIAAGIREQVRTLFTLRRAYAAGAATDSRNEIKVISTTEPALAFTFGGLSNEAAVTDVLHRLDVLGIKGTFFVMEVEASRYPKLLRKIIARGHEIGIGIRPGEEDTFAETRQNIARMRTLLQEQFGLTSNLVKQPWGPVSAATKQAVASLDCHLIGQSVNVVQSSHKDYATADQVMGGIFGKAVFSLARGQIVHFRMDYYTNDRLAGDLVEAIKRRKVDNIAYATSFDSPGNNPANDSQYAIKPVGGILAQRSFIYQYPADPETVPGHLRYDRPGLKTGQYQFLPETAKRYIGHKNVNYEDRMVGFSKMEVRRLDMSGQIHTEDNVIFLTFDDWGTDAAVNKLLYVLRKHQAPGAFFVITNNVLNNPNLLRAIAAAGHELGSHSEKHQPMAVGDPVTGRQTQTQNKEEYRQELGLSYQKLQDVAGDVVVNGKPALTRFFRPPTLAISKMGVEALFETGYEYIVSGSFSTNDYKAESAAQLVRTIKDGIYAENGEVKKGAILVMHMSDSSVYTAMALDILLTANAAKADTDPSKFKVGRLSDYLTDGYSQSNRKHSLRLNSLR